MTDLLEVLRELDPQPGRPRYDEDTVARLVADIVRGDRAPAPVGSVVTPEPTAVVSARRTVRRRPARRQVAIGAVAAVALAVVVAAVAVGTGLMRPIAGPVAPAGRDVDALFGTRMDPTTITRQVAVPTPTGDVVLWFGTSAALGDCLAVTEDGSGWSAAPTVDRAWRPLASGAACMDSGVNELVLGAGLIARFTRDGGGEAVYAGRVTTPDRAAVATGPASGVATDVDVETAGVATRPAEVASGFFLTPPVATGPCTTVAARNSAGALLSSDQVDPNCPANPTVRQVTAGSSRPDIVADDHRYADQLGVTLSTLRPRDPADALTVDPDVTLLTVAVEFLDTCDSAPLPVGKPVPITRNPCLDKEIPLPMESDLELFYGPDRTPASQVQGVPGTKDDFTSPPSAGYVGRKLFGFFVTRTFAVPTDAVNSLTVRWPGDDLHAPLVMPDAQRTIDPPLK